MGKRGPKSSGGYGDKTRVLSTRITAQTRQGLEVSAKSNGLSLSSEIEHRLRRSFDDDRIVDLLGGPQLYAILRTIAASMDMTGRQALFTAHGKVGGALDWLNDPYAYDQALEATMRILDALRPAGDRHAPVFLAKDIAEVVGGGTKEGAAKQVSSLAANLGRLLADSVLRDVAEAEPTQPPPGLPRRKALARRIASDLSSIGDRLKPKGGQS